MEADLDFLGLFLEAASRGMERVRPYAEGLIVTLAILSATLTFAMGALRRDFDPIAAILGKILFVGAIFWLVRSWADLMTILIDGAVFLGVEAGGGGDPNRVLQPLSIITWGWDFANLCLARVGDLSTSFGFLENFAVIVLLTVCALVVAFAYLLIGVAIAVALVEFWLGSAVVLALLPFAVFEPLSFVAKSAFAWVAANAVRLMLYAAITAMGDAAFDLLALIDPGLDEITAEQAFTGVAVAVFLLGLTLSAHRMAFGFVSGGPQLGYATVTAPMMTVAQVAASTASAGALGPGRAALLSIARHGGRLIGSARDRRGGS